ncbi:tripartite tricarboxylate transporter substrate binding protein [Roseomonas stagni]|uniref:Tripartite tricarboxylate transporter substrate binding protein n=1 Tax=Falsiroseomonas algicola TaxID=2716930 RepID=A0A6M1LMH1_9PROT|nr:tripartite tricarboxylate transporter substrate binding protein [Falsiroseomonas algicola]NGM21556.1 tripartite tricarboxylate transporter substrate binding protein [Falsiroseomonas algicola]
MIARRTLLLSTLAPPALAQPAWTPSRPMRMVVPFAPGGAADTVGRLIAEQLAAQLGQPMTVENRPGGGTTIGAVAVARAAADGHTLLYATPNVQILNPHLMRSLPYDPVADFAPVIAVLKAPKLLVVRPDFAARDVAGLIAMARREANALTFASAGVASSGHLAAAMLGQMANVEMLHVPFRGTAPAVQEVMGGRVDFMMDNIATLLPLVRDGRLRALAVSTADPAAAAPELPRVAQTLPGYHDASFNYLLAPARTPPEVIAVLNATVNAILDQPAMRSRFEALGIEKLGGTPEALAAMVREESDRWGPVIRRGGITAE